MPCTCTDGWPTCRIAPTLVLFTSGVRSSVAVKVTTTTGFDAAAGGLDQGELPVGEGDAVGVVALAPPREVRAKRKDDGVGVLGHGSRGRDVGLVVRLDVWDTGGHRARYDGRTASARFG